MFTRSQRTLARGLMLVMGVILVGVGGVLYALEILSEIVTVDDWVYRKARVMASTIRYPQVVDLGPQGVPDEQIVIPALDLEIDLDRLPPLGNLTPVLHTDLLYIRWYDRQGDLQRFSGLVPSTITSLAPDDVGFISRSLQVNATTVWVRQLTLPVVYQGQIMGYLQVAASLTPVEETLRGSRLGFSVALPFGIGVISLMSWSFGGAAMQPIRRSHQALERFTSDASHELRSPVAAILNNAEVGLMTDDPQEQRLRLERIVTLGHSLTSLMNSLFLLARLQGKDTLPWRQPVNLTYVLTRLEQDYAHRAAAAGLVWEGHLPKEPFMLFGHGELLGLALGNLLSNACRYTLAGGMVRFGCVVADDRATITVADTGIGIAPEELPHICDRFYRSDTARSRQDGGFGLGLAIAQHIITAHRGTLMIQSQLHQGSTFTVQLPLSPDQ